MPMRPSTTRVCHSVDLFQFSGLEVVVNDYESLDRACGMLRERVAACG